MASKTLFMLLTAGVMLMVAVSAAAHCEIPCGIYDDRLRARMLAEHANTIEKSMRQIVGLSGKTPVNYNQMVRWVNNKEEHAEEVQHIVWQYFMAQRIRPDAEKYGEKLAVLHQMLLTAMKCKQTTDLEQVKQLRVLLKKFEILYFGGALQ